MDYQIEPLKIGSDPEFMFGRRQDLEYANVPANTIFGSNKKVTTSAFIGTDGHAATGELRPSPARSVKRHLYDLAVAITAAWDFTRRRRRLQDLELIAMPMVGGESVGGHIHVSMFTDDKTWVKCAVTGNVYWHPSHGWNTIRPNLPAGIGSEAMNAAEQIIRKKDILKHFTLQNWGQGMNYLLLPLENWLQPWSLRVQRNTNYGGPISPDLVRLGTSWQDAPAGWGYAHLEYRLPSTWLIHPWMAYAYLAAAKLTVANWAKVAPLVVEAEKLRKKRVAALLSEHGPAPVFPPWPTITTDTTNDPYQHPDEEDDGDYEDGAPEETYVPPAPPEPVPESPPPTPRNNMEWGDLLLERLGVAQGWRWPRDTVDLSLAIDYCKRKREEWFAGQRGRVDVDAWRRLAG